MLENRGFVIVNRIGDQQGRNINQGVESLDKYGQAERRCIGSKRDYHFGVRTVLHAEPRLTILMIDR